MRTTDAELVSTVERDGFEVRVYHIDDEDPDLSFMGEFIGRPKGYPYYDRALRAIVHDEAQRIELSDDDRGDNWDNRSYRYIHAFQKASDDRAEWDRAILADVARLESYGDQWSCIGVRAEAWKNGVMLGESMGIWGIESDGSRSYFQEVEQEQQNEAVAEAKKKLEQIKGHERWTDQQERLLRAAQDVVNDAGTEPEMGPGTSYLVDRDTLDALRAIVQEISDDAIEAIKALGREPYDSECAADNCTQPRLASYNFCAEHQNGPCTSVEAMCGQWDKECPLHYPKDVIE